MICKRVVSKLSAYLDDALPSGEGREVTAHLTTCAACAERRRSLRQSLSMLRALEPLRPAEPFLPRLMMRLEVETRGPGLALLFRPFWRARPLILPSLLPAALCFLGALAGAITLDSLPPSSRGRGVVAPGSASHPLELGEMSTPLLRAPVLADDLVPRHEQSLFFQTVIAPDGRVAEVNLVDGSPASAGGVRNALLRERFEPMRHEGRPVSISVYRLISRLDVQAPQM